LFYNFLDCSHVVCLYQKSVCQFNVLVCKAVRLAFSCRTSAISFPFIPVPWVTLYASYRLNLLLLKGQICVTLNTYINYAFKALCAPSLFQLWTFSLWIHRILLEENFINFDYQYILPGTSCAGPTQNLDSTIQPFWCLLDKNGQTNKKTLKAKYIFRWRSSTYGNVNWPFPPPCYFTVFLASVSIRSDIL